MSIRFEYVPNTALMAWVNELDLAEENPIDMPQDAPVLVLWYDEAIVIPGTFDDMIDFAHRIEATVRAAAGPDKRPMRIDFDTDADQLQEEADGHRAT